MPIIGQIDKIVNVDGKITLLCFMWEYIKKYG